MAAIRVLQLFTILNRGGAETNLMNYYRRLDRSKIQFDFVVHREEKGAFEDEIIQLGGKIFRLPAIHPFHLKSYKKAVANFFEEHNHYAIIHGQCSELGLFIYKEAHKRKVPVIIAHAHNSNMYFDLKSIFRWYWKKQMMNYVNTYFSCGLQSSIWLFGASKASEAFVMNNAIDSNRFKYNPSLDKQVRAQLKANNTINSIHIGRFNVQKNHDFLIDIFNELVKFKNNHRLFLVGEGELMEHIKKKVALLNLEEHVLFLGTRNDVNDLLNGMDILLFPSLFEGFPVAFVEAQANGLQCVVSTGIPSEAILIPENVEVLSLKDAPNDWAEKINGRSSFTKKDCQLAIKQKGFDIESNVRKLESKYIELLNLKQ